MTALPSSYSREKSNPPRITIAARHSAAQSVLKGAVLKQSPNTWNDVRSHDSRFPPIASAFTVETLEKIITAHGMPLSPFQVSERSVAKKYATQPAV